jgi:hypothetical protein
MKHNIKCPIEKVKEMILDAFPNHYGKTYEERFKDIAYFVKPIHQEQMMEYMDKTNVTINIELPD